MVNFSASADLANAISENNSKLGSFNKAKSAFNSAVKND